MGMGAFNVVTGLGFVIAAGILAVVLVNGIKTWVENNNAPRLTVPAVVVSKRAAVQHHHQPNAGDPTGAHGYHVSISQTYYVTFQISSGERKEFSVGSQEFGFLAEGDEGNLSFQGSRYLGFREGQEEM